MIPVRILRTLALAAAPLLLAGEARACSKFAFVAWRAPAMAHLIGTAAPDTALAGPGTVRFRVAPGHSGPAGERTVYGQVVEAERVGGLAASRLPAGTTRVLLVPWDYGPDCTPTPWTRSARWVRPGVRGLFHGNLRDPAGWVDGMPTLDVMSPELEPYPLRLGRAADTPPDSLLSVEQLFELMDLLPSTRDRSGDESAAAAAPLFEWVRMHPELARRYPAVEIVRYAESSISYARLRDIDPPLAGTYRFTATLGDDPPLVFHARSRSRASTWWSPSRTAAGDGDGGSDPEGYTLLFSTAGALDSLPSACCRSEAYISLLRAPEREPGPGGAQIWRGDIEANLVARQFPGNAALAQFARAWQERSYGAYMRREPYAVEARFFVLPDGSVRVEQTTDLGDGRRMVIRGERISRVTIPDPY